MNESGLEVRVLSSHPIPSGSRHGGGVLGVRTNRHVQSRLVLPDTTLSVGNLSVARSDRFIRASETEQLSARPCVSFALLARNRGRRSRGRRFGRSLACARCSSAASRERAARQSFRTPRRQRQDRRLRSRRRPGPFAADDGRHDGGHRCLHAAGAGARPPAGRALRPLFAGMRDARDGDGRAPFLATTRCRSSRSTSILRRSRPPGTSVAGRRRTRARGGPRSGCRETSLATSPTPRVLRDSERSRILHRSGSYPLPSRHKGRPTVSRAAKSRCSPSVVPQPLGLYAALPPVSH